MASWFFGWETSEGEKKESEESTAAPIEFVIGETVHSETIQKGKSGSVVEISDGKVVVKFTDELDPVKCDPCELKKGIPMDSSSSYTDQALPAVAQPPEISSTPEASLTAAVDDIAKTGSPGQKIEQATTEPVQAKDDNLITLELTQPEAVAEQIATAPVFIGSAPLVEHAASTNEEPTLVQLESAIMQPEPELGPAVDSVNSTPLKEEASSTAPATPELSIAIPRPASSEDQQLKQTPVYAALPTIDTGTHIGTLMTVPDLRPMTRNKFFAPPTPLNQCGADRQRLRDMFNTLEITIELVFKKFDADGNNFLDQSELRKLLEASASAARVSVDDAVRFVLVVADENQDERISRKELEYGLQAWHAFNNMPSEVNRAMKNALIKPDGSPMPRLEDLRSLLKDLNGFIDPDLEEVHCVRRAALAVGGTEAKVTTEQMRMAISVWYTNVERKVTPVRAQMEFSFNGWVRGVGLHLKRLIQQLPSTGVTLGMVSVDDLEAPLQGEHARQRNAPDLVNPYTLFTDNKCNEMFGAILWMILFILPGIFMVHVAEDYPTMRACEHDLSLLLQWKGYLALAIGFSGLMYQIVYDGQFRSLCLVVGLASVVVTIIQEIVGLGYVIFSTQEKCGSYIWNVNAFFFVWSLFWGPCLCCLCICTCSGYAYNHEFESVMAADTAVHTAGR